ncbi:hypothetical protein [Pseudomonas sp. BLCC-B112]|uniref:Uncharacterized protein n=2 Tax=Pseudomonas protegens TaxID=380021 RepID=A0A9Q6IIU5_9PSED|nr:hypothetical protein [Pseudomonas sp. BLCC-B112]MDC7813870.1 hypothetical protein [Pseudomonas sp. BLCC-B112]PYC40160.1 hypothetical protein DMX08_09155 [Pseudomonas protegens]
MGKDHEVGVAEVDTDAKGNEPAVMAPPANANEQVQAIAEHWRGAWSDLSRTDAFVAQGPSFVLWRYEKDGFESPGTFFPSEAIDQTIPHAGMREAMRQALAETDHERHLVAVIVLKGDVGAAMSVIPKTAVCKEQAWFEMTKIRKSSVSDKVWIPLRADYMLTSEGEYGYEGYLEEYFGVGSVMFDLQHRDEISKLGWGDIGGNTFAGGEETHRAWPNENGHDTSQDSSPTHTEQGTSVASFRVPFTDLNLSLRTRPTKSAAPPEPVAPAEPTFVTTYYWAGDWASHHSDAVGTGLIIEQNFDGAAPNEWHLHQDFVISLGLQREGDIWLRPVEGFLEVVRLKRDEQGKPVLLEARTEHLRDYLKARGMYLLLTSYRNRSQIVSDASYIDWASGFVQEEKDGREWEGINSEIHEGGKPYGSSTGVFHVSRTDVDADDDVPKLGLPDDDSVVSKSWSIQHEGRKLHSLSGSLSMTEVVEPGRVSERVKGEASLTKVDFAINASGERISGDELESTGGWLWFRPNVTTLLGSYRGSYLRWYTRDTGAIGISIGDSVHFGLNSLGLLNVYAKDIGRLPPWQQRVWAGANMVPEGGVSEELLASQAKASPADTKAPEARLRPAYDELNATFEKVSGKPLFSPHHATDDIFKRVHRFRALENTGVLELAKDLARLTVESLDGAALTVMGAQPGKTKSGSVKHVEAGLMTREATLEEARALTKVLVGINQLRQADAHLPSSGFADAFDLVGVDQQADPVAQGRQMLELLVDSLLGMTKVFASQPSKPSN